MYSVSSVARSMTVGHSNFRLDVHLAETVYQIILMSALFGERAELIHYTVLTY